MKKKSNKQRVLEILIRAVENNHNFTFYGFAVPKGWVPLGAICNPECGGSEGTRRIREMRADGINIDHCVFKVNVNGEPRHTWIYQIKTPSHLINRENCKLRNNISYDYNQNGQYAII